MLTRRKSHNRNVVMSRDDVELIAICANGMS